MPIKIVLNDVDECLSRQIPSDGISFNSQHIKDIAEFSKIVKKYSGIEFVLCSGRSFNQLEGIIKKIKGLTWVISENGSLIHNLSSEEEIDLAEFHPAKKYLEILKEYAVRFAEGERIPKKKNMLTIDILEKKNPAYFNSFIQTLPPKLYRDCINAGISFGWDPTAVNITLPVSKYDGIKRLFSILSVERGVSRGEFYNQSLYVGDSTSDIMGMQACRFAATISNGDEKNIKVQKFISDSYLNQQRGYISPFSYGEGNRDCIVYFLEEKK